MYLQIPAVSVVVCFLRNELIMKDSFGREINYLRLSVTDRCNLRCRYCMPENGIEKKEHSQMLTEEEMLSAVRICSSLGINKVRVTGGEPLLKKNILSICSGIAAIPGIDELCLTTNGTMLPQMARNLKETGVGRVNISLDTLNPKKYRRITRIGNLEDALKGLESALDAGFERIKINTVLIGGFNDDEIIDLANLTKQYDVDLRFIELMPMTGDSFFSDSSYVPSSVVLQRLTGLESVGDEGVSRTYRLPGAKGTVGLISPLSNMFCPTCNRIRITADGKVKPCLHKPEEFTIKGLDEIEMRAVLQKAICAKPPCHDELSSEHATKAGRAMFRIGG